MRRRSRDEILFFFSVRFLRIIAKAFSRALESENTPNHDSSIQNIELNRLEPFRLFARWVLFHYLKILRLTAE